MEFPGRCVICRGKSLEKVISNHSACKEFKLAGGSTPSVDAKFLAEPINVHAIMCSVCQAQTLKIKDFLAGPLLI